MNKFIYKLYRNVTNYYKYCQIGRLISKYTKPYRAEGGGSDYKYCQICKLISKYTKPYRAEGGGSDCLRYRLSILEKVGKGLMFEGF